MDVRYISVFSGFISKETYTSYREFLERKPFLTSSMWANICCIFIIIILLRSFIRGENPLRPELKLYNAITNSMSTSLH